MTRRSIKRSTAIQPVSGGLAVHAKCYGNQDFGQYAPIGPDLHLAVRDMTCAVRAYLAWISLFNLGGGNAGDGQIVDEHGAEVGRISYNGRVWPPGKWTAGMVPLREPTSADFAAGREAAYQAATVQP